VLALGRFVQKEPLTLVLRTPEALAHAISDATGTVLGSPRQERRADYGVMSILAVDDDAFILELIPKIAAKAGCPDVTTTSSGAGALGLLTQAAVPFDCFLLDINMPEMDGIELCALIRSLPDYRNTPIIMLTAMTDIENLDRAFRAGATDYTSKPFDIIQFAERLQIAQKTIADMRTDVKMAAANGPIEPHPDYIADWADARPVQAAGSTDLIEFSALQNYMSKLSGVLLLDAYVLAISVERREATIGASDAHSISSLLTQVNASITDAFHGTSYVTAYAGHGQFVLMSRAKDLPESKIIEATIQYGLDGRGVDRSAEFSPANISVGMAIRLGSRRARRASIACDTAITLAANREASKKAVRAGQLRFSGQG
jgi:CheY-like chemotaxis protein